MNKNTIDKLIPDAIKELKTLEKSGKIEKVYNGYLASFGPTVITSGLKKTVTIYADKASSNVKRRRVTQIMFDLIGEDMDGYVAQKGNEKDYAFKQRLLEANIACKLAIRTFVLREE